MMRNNQPYDYVMELIEDPRRKQQKHQQAFPKAISVSEKVQPKPSVPEPLSKQSQSFLADICKKEEEPTSTPTPEDKSDNFNSQIASCSQSQKRKQTEVYHDKLSKKANVSNYELIQKSNDYKLKDDFQK